MKVYTSYFYQVRFFKPYMIPISTAKSDPKWYHENRGNDHWFVDKNGVINGLRAAEAFAPGPQLEGMCRGQFDANTCGYPGSCPFLRGYANQLANLDFWDTFKRLGRLAFSVQQYLGFDEEPIIVLLVHEAPQNHCSERAAIQKWFRKNGVECEELGDQSLMGQVDL